jgi:hypothetical protein
MTSFMDDHLPDVDRDSLLLLVLTCKFKALAMQLRKTSTIPGLCMSKPLSPPLSEAVVKIPKSFGGKLVTPIAFAKLPGGTSGRTLRSRDITCRWIRAEPVKNIFCLMILVFKSKDHHYCIYFSNNKIVLITIKQQLPKQLRKYCYTHVPR